MIELRSLVLLVVHLLLVQNSIGQSTKMDEPYKLYPFVKEEANIISNSEHLAALMEKLYDLKRNGNRTINILHIGDSHIQADYITSIIRTALQKEFGNGGRGLIVPLRVAKTNEPLSYVSFSTYLWQSKKCAFPEQSLPIGIGGITISTTDSSADFGIRIANNSPMNYRFKKVILFSDNDPASYRFALLDSLGNQIGMFMSDSINNYPFISSAAFTSPTNVMKIKVVKTNKNQSRATVYGLLLENDSSGIIYHTAGVNGARLRHYSVASHFTEQTKELKPDLIIISLGTNEAFDINFNQDMFYADMQLLFNQLKRENPKAEFLITIPACSYRRNKPNALLPLAAKTIIRFTTNNYLAYWNLQEITGGNNSAYNWKKFHLLLSDGVHYSREGYELQGSLFSKALLNAYNAYVANRPK
jgi:lysophospholipase L1-like esterase